MFIKNKENDYPVNVELVEDKDEFIVFTKYGIMNRLKVSEITKISRIAMGSRVVQLKDDDEVLSIVKVV